MTTAELKKGDRVWCWWMHRYLWYTGLSRQSTKTGETFWGFRDAGDAWVEIEDEDISELTEEKPKASNMTTKRCIEDLKTIKAYFIQQSGGSYPECIEYAIEQLEKQEKATENPENFVEPQAVTSEQLDVKED